MWSVPRPRPPAPPSQLRDHPPWSTSPSVLCWLWGEHEQSRALHELSRRLRGHSRGSLQGPQAADRQPPPPVTLATRASGGPARLSLETCPKTLLGGGSPTDSGAPTASVQVLALPPPSSVTLEQVSQPLCASVCPSMRWRSRTHLQDVPGGPAARILHSQCRGPRFKPWSGN